jgi:hypothetical protein
VARSLDSATNSFAVLLFAIAGGEPKELFRVNAPYRVGNFMLWAPDSTGVIVEKMSPDNDDQQEFWLLPVRGGQAKKLDNALSARKAGFNPQMRVHPDGRRIAYVGGKQVNEVWVLENFLSEAAAGK